MAIQSNNKAGGEMIRFPSGQRGITFIGFVLLMVGVGFVALVALKLAPVYLDHYKVVSVLKSLENDKDLASRSRDEILRTFEKRWDIDMIDSVTRDDVTIIKDIHHIKVQIAYDVTKPILGNVDALIHFDDAIEVDAN
ncbi:DUF4845 domain-containing protein [Methylomagnum sp.]